MKLLVNGSQAGTILPSVASDGSAFFDLSSNPAMLNTGSNNLKVLADITGSPGMTFQFEILNAHDLLAVDMQYNVPVAGQANVGTQIAITQGSATVTSPTTTPTGTIAKGQSNVTLARFELRATSEPIRLRFLGFNITFSGATSSLPSLIRNVMLVDETGLQVGTTITTPPSGAGCDTATSGTTGSSFSTSTGIYADCFGTSSSPINYVIPANTTRVLSLRADIQSTAGFNTAIASLTGNSNNVQGIISAQTASTGSASGGSLTLAISQFTVSPNTAVGTQTFAKKLKRWACE